VCERSFTFEMGVAGIFSRPPAPMNGQAHKANAGSKIVIRVLVKKSIFLGDISALQIQQKDVFVPGSRLVISTFSKPLSLH
jgi:hypothetical protein